MLYKNLPLQIKSKQTKAHMKSSSSFAAACFLVERGASLQIKNHAGQTALNLVHDPAAIDVLNHHARSVTVTVLTTLTRDIVTVSQFNCRCLSLGIM